MWTRCNIQLSIEQIQYRHIKPQNLNYFILITYSGKQGMRKAGNVVGIEARAIHNTLIHNNNRGGYYNDGGSVKSIVFIPFIS